MKLVVAVDGEESAKSALSYIAEEKYTSDTEIHLIHVIVPAFADAMVEGIPNLALEETAEEQKVLNHMAGSLKKTLNLNATVEILTGSEIAEVITEACKKYNADAVIVPTHARHGFSRLWFGSVADEIVDATPCTTIVLKMPQTKD